MEKYLKLNMFVAALGLATFAYFVIIVFKDLGTTYATLQNYFSPFSSPKAELATFFLSLTPLLCLSTALIAYRNITTIWSVPLAIATWLFLVSYFVSFYLLVFVGWQIFLNFQSRSNKLNQAGTSQNDAPV